jgi:hypothetical protein
VYPQAGKLERGRAFDRVKAIGVRPGAPPELIAAGIAIARECEIAGITLSQYDGADFMPPKAVRAGLVTAQLIRA